VTSSWSFILQLKIEMFNASFGSVVFT